MTVSVGPSIGLPQTPAEDAAIERLTYIAERAVNLRQHFEALVAQTHSVSSRFDHKRIQPNGPAAQACMNARIAVVRHAEAAILMPPIA